MEKMIHTTDTNSNTIASEKKYWDELQVGEEFTFGQYAVSEKEIIDFATRFDPMEFHTDPEKAKQSPLGALCASGIHTLAIMQRLSFDHVFKNLHIVAGKELRRCQFLRPVFVDNILSVIVKVISLSEGNRKDRGNVKFDIIVNNADFQPVLEVQGEMVILKKIAH
jgi:acyl dehydratase